VRIYGRADLSGVKGFTSKQMRENTILESVEEGKYVLRVEPGSIQGKNWTFVSDLSNVRIYGGREGATLGGVAGLLQ
jgi:hypothetical protein